MGLTDLFAENAVIKWLRGDTTRHDMTATLAGVELGGRVLLIGCSDPRLATVVASKTGLSGTATAIDEVPARIEAVRRHAERAGVLVESASTSYTALPVDDGLYDLALVSDAHRAAGPDDLSSALPEIHRALREGGRVMILVPLAGARRRVDDASIAKEPEVIRLIAALQAHGFRAARLLVVREATAFVEGAKPRSVGSAP